jgi:hypothetical protein
MDNEKCIAITTSGSQCGSWALKDSKFCFMHDSRKKEEMDLARSIGGRSVKKIEGMNVYLETTDDILAVISETISNLRSMPITINQAKAIVSACDSALHVIELKNLTDRIDTIERELGLNE